MPRHLNDIRYNTVNRALLLLLLAFCVFFIQANLFFSPVFAQQTPVVSEPLNIDTIIERIRLYYGLKQYKQVLLECRKLEQLDPNNKMILYYKGRAEARLKEMGMLETTLEQIAREATPVPTHTLQTPAPSPSFSPAPSQTRVAPLPTLPGLAPTTKTPIPKTTSPFSGAVAPVIPSSTPPTVATTPPEITRSETPLPTLTPAESTPAPPEPTVSTPPEPEPPSGLLAKIKNLQASNPPLFFGLLAAVIIFIAVFALLVFFFIRRFTMKKHLETLKNMASEGKETIVQEPESKATIPYEEPEAPELTPPFPFQSKEPPQPEMEPELPPAPGVEDIPSPEQEPPPLPEMPEPADIPSPSGFQNIPQDTQQELPELPDIPSPTAPPPSPSPQGEQIPGFASDVPPDLPTLPEAEPPSLSPQAEQDVELPPVPLNLENPIEAPELKTPPQDELSPDPQAPALPESKSEESPELEEEKQEDEVQPAVFPSPEENMHGEKQEEPKALSIEQALGMEQPPPEDQPEPSPEDQLLVFDNKEEPQKEKDSASTSMELDAFLFSPSSEENAETILDVPSKKLQDQTPEQSTPESGEIQLQEEESESEELKSLLLGEDDLAETKIKPPEKEEEEFTPFAFTEQEDLESPDNGEPPPLSISMETEDGLGETKIKDAPFSTSGRMERLSPFEDKEREDHGISLPFSEPEPLQPAPFNLDQSEPKTQPPVFEEQKQVQQEKISLDILGQPEHASLDLDQEKQTPHIPSAPPSFAPPPLDKSPEEKTKSPDDVLFEKQFQMGNDAFDKGDWKKAIYYFNIAAAIKPDHKKLKELLATARKNKRTSG